MILSSPGDILFEFGKIKIYYYGVIMAISVLLGLFACNIICKKFYEKQDWEITYNLALGTIISGFLGARIYYVLAAHNYYLKHLNEIFAVHHGGMSIHGAILGGIIFACIYLWRKKLSILKYLDIMTFGLLTGQIIGRWGNFFNSEAFGLPTFSFLKLYIPIQNRPAEFMVFDYFHPTFLYESLLNLILLVILIFVLKHSGAKNCTLQNMLSDETCHCENENSENVAGKNICHSEGNLLPEKSKINRFFAVTQNDGIVFFTYILFYSIIRIFVEQIRLDSVLNFGNVPLAQAVSAIGIVRGIIGLIIIFKKK